MDTSGSEQRDGSENIASFSSSSPNDERNIILKVTVELSATECDTILVRKGDTPLPLATAFCKWHNLQNLLVKPLADHIQASLEKATGSDGSVKTQSSSPRRPPSPHRSSSNQSARVSSVSPASQKSGFSRTPAPSSPASVGKDAESTGGRARDLSSPISPSQTTGNGIAGVPAQLPSASPRQSKGKGARTMMATSPLTPRLSLGNTVTKASKSTSPMSPVVRHSPVGKGVPRSVSPVSPITPSGQPLPTIVESQSADAGSAFFPPQNSEPQPMASPPTPTPKESVDLQAELSSEGRICQPNLPAATGNRDFPIMAVLTLTDDNGKDSDEELTRQNVPVPRLPWPGGAENLPCYAIENSQDGDGQTYQPDNWPESPKWPQQPPKTEWQDAPKRGTMEQCIENRSSRNSRHVPASDSLPPKVEESARSRRRAYSEENRSRRIKPTRTSTPEFVRSRVSATSSTATPRPLPANSTPRGSDVTTNVQQGLSTPTQRRRPLSAGAASSCSGRRAYNAPMRDISVGSASKDNAIVARLFRDAAERQQRLAEMQMRHETAKRRAELQESTFSPAISASQRGCRGVGRTSQDPDGRHVRRKIELLRLQKQRMQLQECTFSPAVDENSEAIMMERLSRMRLSGPPYEALYEDALRRQERMQQYAVLSLNGSNRRRWRTRLETQETLHGEFPAYCPEQSEVHVDVGDGSARSPNVLDLFSTASCRSPGYDGLPLEDDSQRCHSQEHSSYEHVSHPGQACLGRPTGKPADTARQCRVAAAIASSLGATPCRNAIGQRPSSAGSTRGGGGCRVSKGPTLGNHLDGTGQCRPENTNLPQRPRSAGSLMSSHLACTPRRVSTGAGNAAS